MSSSEIVGFTGSKDVWTNRQQAVIRELLEGRDVSAVHHGDCIGADTGFHNLACDLGLRVVVHPPSNPKSRSYCEGDEILPCYDYLKRNRHIVDASTLMIAAPKCPEVMRSGTWSTIRYARKQAKHIYMVYPTGKVIMEMYGYLCRTS